MSCGRMLFTTKYIPVFQREEPEEGTKGESVTADDDSGEFSLCRHPALSLYIFIAFLFGGLIAGVILLSLRILISAESTPDPTCRNPVIRREWRSLSRDERTEYIKVVQCLQQKPSRLGLGHGLHHDFPYVHIHVGNDSHHTGMFLAWHRYLIHIYEEALQHDCGYSGHLAYWDWSLDWENLTVAPVFDNEVGFGSDGNKSDTSPSIHGHCVTTGPFARLEVPYVEQFSYPHCLSRDFAHGENLTSFAHAIRPSSIETLLQIENERTFVLAVEEGPHLSIPRTVHGDFSTITAPADPLFYLHHAQLDRLWWRWQQQHHSAITKHTDDAYLDSLISVGGLAPDITLRDIVNTELGILCYRY